MNKVFLKVVAKMEDKFIKLPEVRISLKKEGK